MISTPTELHAAIASPRSEKNEWTNVQIAATRRGNEDALWASVLLQIVSGYVLDPLDTFACVIGPGDVGDANPTLVVQAMRRLAHWNTRIHPECHPQIDRKFFRAYLQELRWFCHEFATTLKTRYVYYMSILCTHGMAGFNSLVVGPKNRDEIVIAVETGQCRKRGQGLHGNLGEACLQVLSNSNFRLVQYFARLVSFAPGQSIPRAGSLKAKFCLDMDSVPPEMTDDDIDYIPSEYLFRPGRERLQREEVARARRSWHLSTRASGKLSMVYKNATDPDGKRHRVIRCAENERVGAASKCNFVASPYDVKNALLVGAVLRPKHRDAVIGTYLSTEYPSNCIVRGPYKNDAAANSTVTACMNMIRLAKRCGVVPGVLTPEYNQTARSISWPNPGAPLSSCKFVHHVEIDANYIMVRSSSYAKAVDETSSDEHIQAALQTLLFAFVLGIGRRRVSDFVIGTTIPGVFMIDGLDTRSVATPTAKSRLLCIAGQTTKAFAARCAPLISKLVIPPGTRGQYFRNLKADV